MRQRTAGCRRRIGLLCAALAVALAGCSGSGAHVPQPAVAIHPDDACAVCGMYMKDTTGPRAEAYVDGRATPLKFESTRDFFAYVLQADVRARLGAVYVQDSARIDWRHPGGAPSSFTDARTAYYVAWQPLRGGMGPTLASFARRQDADAFIRRHGGARLRFADVSAELVSRLGYHCPDDEAQRTLTHAACMTPAGSAAVNAGASTRVENTRTR